MGVVFKRKLFREASLSCKKKKKKRKRFHFKKKIAPSVLFQKPLFKENEISKGHLKTRFTKILVHEDVFNWYLNLLPKNPCLQKQNGFKKEISTWFAKVSKALS
jgi:hypothetical protein